MPISILAQGYLQVFLSRYGQCYSAGVITGSFISGGIAGYNHGLVMDSYAQGALTSSDTVGGLVGENWGTIHSSYAAVQLHASEPNYCGGIVGRNFPQNFIANGFFLDSRGSPGY